MNIQETDTIRTMALFVFAGLKDGAPAEQSAINWSMLVARGRMRHLKVTNAVPVLLLLTSLAFRPLVFANGIRPLRHCDVHMHI